MGMMAAILWTDMGMMAAILWTDMGMMAAILVDRHGYDGSHIAIS
jgi:hypothetical protein